ncbi:MAG: hypothetical protein ICV66_08080, partial [Chitinophagaceae bacterium]|nr:hypothetical protein [Chitinophagaceae bacterium]
TIPIDTNIWEDAVSKLQDGYMPNISHQLLLDGDYFTATQDTRRAIIEFAIACESAKDQTYKRLWEAKNFGQKYKKSKLLGGSNNLPDHLSTYFLRIFKHSYQLHHPENFQIISDLWNARGNVAHGGKPIFVHKIKRQKVFVDQRVCTVFSQAALHCINWLFSL